MPTPLSKAAATARCRRRSRGLTMIEIMVVIGIIVLLLALLIPAVGAARTAAKVAATKAQMSQIAQACEGYYQQFHAYPGTLPEISWTGGTVTWAANPTVGTFNSTQNMLAGLSLGWDAGSYISVATAAPLNGTAFSVSNNPNVRITDWSTNRQYDPYLPLKQEQVQVMNPANGSTATPYNLPVLVDNAFDPPLPILYYRMDVPFNPAVVGSQICSTDPGAARACFYVSANAGLTATYPQVANLTGTVVGTTFYTDLTQNIAGADVPRGKFVLISAGPDRVFGTGDDIIIAGGN